MKKLNSLYIYIAFTMLLFFNSCYNETRLLVNADFQAIVKENNYTSPVKIELQNNSTGADFYQWSFEGGTPSSSTQKEPELITYDKAGTYTIKLEAWNNTERSNKEFTFSVDSAVNVKFDTEILINDFAPADVKITNRTVGASTFQWSFAGGIPATSTERDPGNIHFDTAGEHLITLTVNNGRESFSGSKTINLDPALNIGFTIEPSFDDFDYEVPFTAHLTNNSSSALNYEWSTTGGTVTQKNSKDTEVSFQSPGTYTITLKAQNGKETKTLDKQITLKKNTNLYTLNDVKFGIKKAELTVGCFYSLSQRSIILQKDINASNGRVINLVFFGLDSSFSRCYFTSPDNVFSSGFNTIPNAVKTYYINNLSETSLNFTGPGFDSMVDDIPLRALDIKNASSTNSWFTNVFIPRIVLFETGDGIKGAIRIKAFVSQGDNSYILTDIKVQKEKAL